MASCWTTLTWPSRPTYAPRCCLCWKRAPMSHWRRRPAPTLQTMCSLTSCWPWWHRLAAACGTVVPPWASPRALEPRWSKPCSTCALCCCATRCWRISCASTWTAARRRRLVRRRRPSRACGGLAATWSAGSCCALRSGARRSCKSEQRRRSARRSSARRQRPRPRPAQRRRRHTRAPRKPRASQPLLEDPRAAKRKAQTAIPRRRRARRTALGRRRRSARRAGATRSCV
mmetsp:Transcript_20962/g.67507  ORF Transcript_20962/g.67507 Transcript_20962/m.67507 type:complete len:230 (-) Transcript_20962:4628-5317(-)